MFELYGYFAEGPVKIKNEVEGTDFCEFDAIIKTTNQI